MGLPKVPMQSRVSDSTKWKINHMKYFLIKLRTQSRRVGQIVLVFGVTALVLAYFLGFYDLSFFDRAELLGKKPSTAETESASPPPETENSSSTSQNPSDNTNPSDDPSFQGNPSSQGNSNSQDNPSFQGNLNSQGNSNSSGVTAPSNQGTDNSYPIAKETRSVVNVVDPNRLSDAVKNVSTVTSLEKSHYTLTTQDWNSKMRLGLMSFPYAMPKGYSLNTRTVQKLQYVYPENFTEYYATTVEVTEARPAIELYMGYILYDNGEQVILMDQEGNILQAIDTAVTVPAYERDRAGTPLFYRWSWNGTEKEKVYYQLSPDGKSFVPSTYDPILDSRGLQFDYPADFGLSDNSSLVRMQEGEEMVLARLEEEEARLAAMTEEEREAESEQQKLDKTVVFNAYENQRIAYYRNGQDLTGYIFRQAFNFQNGFAAVVGDENRQELYFIRENGKKALSGYRMYLKTDYERYVVESWRLPASYGIESIGSLYFDNGWVRVRKQRIDHYAYMTYDNIRVISDTDVLINEKGNEFPIPSGYTLKAYSCGMLLLEKDGKVGFLDYTGNWIAEPIYKDATPFVNNLATLTTPDGRVGMIDTQGNIVLAFAYQAITQPSSGLIASYHAKDGWQLYQILAKENQ